MLVLLLRKDSCAGTYFALQNDMGKMYILLHAYILKLANRRPIIEVGRLYRRFTINPTKCKCRPTYNRLHKMSADGRMINED